MCEKLRTLKKKKGDKLFWVSDISTAGVLNSKIYFLFSFLYFILIIYIHQILFQGEKPIFTYMEKGKRRKRENLHAICSIFCFLYWINLSSNKLYYNLICPDI